MSLASGDISKEEDVGLLSHHSYTVLEIRESGEDQLCKLRNPWGRFTFKGNRCDPHLRTSSANKKLPMGSK